MDRSAGKGSRTGQLLVTPFSSLIDPTFWHHLRDKKLNVLGLDDAPVTLKGFYSNGEAAGLPSRVSMDYTAFENGSNIPSNSFELCGSIRNFNTIEAFNSCDLKAMLKIHTDEVWKSIISKDALAKPAHLAKFFMVTFADLKSFRFHYWVAFPALSLPEIILVVPPKPITSVFTEKQIGDLVQSYTETVLQHQEAFFVIQKSPDGGLTTHRLAQLLPLLGKVEGPETGLLFAFCDPSTQLTYPGWPLRNFLALLSHHVVKTGVQTVDILCFRDRTFHGSRSVKHSLMVSVQLQGTEASESRLKSVGWERNSRNKLAPRVTDLSLTMDPKCLSANAVDLNLKLMLWRVLPDLDLSTIAKTRCLLLGSGTLGCNVARCLMGWGVRKITLLDNGKVSYSNPVRQSLFTFSDCGKEKAGAAVEAMKQIVPGLEADSYKLSVPMPGHPIGESQIQSTLADVDTLEILFRDHDVVFLLMDSRESRWLPTVMGKAMGKIVINAALGFDSWLVMRHGCKPNDEHISDSPSGTGVRNHPTAELGCYFCSDIVAPANSQRERTLDQQCTVARPGLSFIASALAVELLMSLLTHPQGLLAPAHKKDVKREVEGDNECEDQESSLGVVPHMVRGFLSRFDVILPWSASFDKCTACSEKILASYKDDRDEFLLKAFNQQGYLEDLTGLSQMFDESLSLEVLDSDFSDE